MTSQLAYPWGRLLVGNLVFGKIANPLTGKTFVMSCFTNVASGEELGQTTSNIVTINSTVTLTNISSAGVPFDVPGQYTNSSEIIFNCYSDVVIKSFGIGYPSGMSFFYIMHLIPSAPISLKAGDNLAFAPYSILFNFI